MGYSYNEIMYDIPYASLNLQYASMNYEKEKEKKKKKEKIKDIRTDFEKLKDF